MGGHWPMAFQLLEASAASAANVVVKNFFQGDESRGVASSDLVT